MASGVTGVGYSGVAVTGTGYNSLFNQITLSGYSGFTDAQILTNLNSNIVTGYNDLPVATLETFMRLQGAVYPLTKFLASTPSGATTGTVSAVTEMVGILNSPHITVVPMSNPAYTPQAISLFNAIVAGSLWTAGQAAGIVALCQYVTSIATQLGFPNGVSQSDLNVARVVQ